MKNPRDLIIKPIVTEKSNVQMEEKRYSFVVDKSANKIAIKRAVEAIFGVKVKKVNTILVKGKPRRVGVHSGYRPDWKKAIITLHEGSKPIEIYE